jgi:hypothetical protein
MMDLQPRSVTLQRAREAGFFEGRYSLNLTNARGVSFAARIEIRPEGETKAEWISIPKERALFDFPADKTEPIPITVRVPASTAGKRLAFTVKIMDKANSDELYDTQGAELVVPGPGQPEGKKPATWIIPVIIGAVLVLGGLVFAIIKIAGHGAAPPAPGPAPAPPDKPPGQASGPTAFRWGFESGADDWFFAGTAGLDSGKSLEHTGTGNAWVRASSGWNAVNRWVDAGAQHSCDLSAWLRTSDTLTDGYMSVRKGDKSDGSGAVIKEIKLVGARPPGGDPADKGYHLEGFSFDTGDQARVLLYVGLWGVGKDAWIQIDDVSLTCR